MGQPEKFIAAEQQILALGRLLQSLREEDNVDVLISTTISYLKDQFNYSLIWIAVYDRLNHILFGKGGTAPGSDTSFLKKQVLLNPGDLLEQVVIEQRPLGVADLQVELRAGEWQQAATKFKIQGTLILPIRYQDKCLGVVLLGSSLWGFSPRSEEKARLMVVLGELGAVLYHLEMDWLYKHAKRPEQPLLRLLENLPTLSNLEQKLEAVVEASHQFVSPSRTNIYWFEREGRYFWRRMSNQLSKGKLHPIQVEVKITVEELSDFYYALAINQIVWIGEARSSLKSDFTAKLLQRLRVRSVLAAPIIWQKDLLGFLAVEASEPRIWTEADKNFVKGAAGLISLVAPGEQMETTIENIQKDAQLSSQVAQAIYSHNDVEEIFHTCAAKVLERLAATRFLLLQYDAERNSYQILYQSQPQNRRPLTFALDALKELDWQLLQRSTEAVGIENFESDLRFFNWRSQLLENGVRSLLVGNCRQGHPPEALLLIATESNRSWSSLEKQLLWVVSQQIGVVVRQWQLHASTEQQQKIWRSFGQCLNTLKQVESTNTKLESTALEQIASVLNCPLALLLSWNPGEDLAKILPGVIANAHFGIVADTPVPIQTEAVIQWALLSDGMLALTVDDLPPQSRKWLNGAGIGQILVMALRTSADFQPTAVVLMADYRERQWSEQSLIATETLICQLAWWRRWLQISDLLSDRTEELQQLNWYKHRRLEEIQRTVVFNVSQLHNLGIPSNQFAQMRYEQLLRQLDHTTASMTGLLKLEQWQLHITSERMPIASLLKRCKERVDNLLEQRKLWVGVHGLGPGEETQSYSRATHSSLAVAGDVVKVELVLYELLVVACHRSTNNGRIDIWCRCLDERWLEVSITDNGMIEPQLLTELHQDTPPLDVLAFSTLDYPPGLHLLICQRLMQQLGGELHFYQLPDGRVVSRLILPLAGNNF